MSGTTADIIPIVIVPVLALAFLLVMVNYANSHPQWGSRLRRHRLRRAVEGSIPAQRLSSAGPVVPGQRLGTAATKSPPGRRGPAKPEGNSVMTGTVSQPPRPSDPWSLVAVAHRTLTWA